MRLKGLIEPLKKSQDFLKILNGIKDEKYPLSVNGISESARSYLIGTFYDEVKESITIITHSDVEAKNLYEDLTLFLPNVYYFPSKEVVFYNVYAISGDLRWERLKVIREILNRRKKILVCSIDAICATYTPIELFKKYTFKLSEGDNVDFQNLGHKLVNCGYERTERVESKGQFSIRGGIMDIFPPISAMPFRIELFGDEIESIRVFNTESQRSIEKVKSMEVFPAKEVILENQNIDRGFKLIEEDLKVQLKKYEDNSKQELKEKLEKNIKTKLELLKETHSFDTIDSFMPYFFEKTSTFFDYIKGSYIVLDDAQRSKGKIDSIYYEFEEDYASYLERGDVLPKQIEILIDRESIFSAFEENKTIIMNVMQKTDGVLVPEVSVDIAQKSFPSYQGQLSMLIDDVKEKKSKGYRILLLSGTRPRGERLVETLKEYGVESTYKDIVDEINLGQVIITFGNQIKGYEYPNLKLCVISDKDVFGQSKKKSSKKINKKGVGKIKSFTELKPGDYVVHSNHGIGVYIGIKHLQVDNITRDYLDLNYENGDKLYVPVDQLDLVQKYIGSEGKAPKINKLGGAEWGKAKAKVRKSINEIAEDLVKLYATRASLVGHRFRKDTPWQRQFEEEFPFEETPDQNTSIKEIKLDMESDKPMDRLLCGDVGYGKTEVALRAAFKAIMDGKQVAFLVPTTILAEQHYENMKKRFSDFPVKIDMVSRFRTAKQQKETLKAVKEGNVDILIGTHRILQKDVEFKDLGILIIDEEQRFGVAHKEKIKAMKKNIDVLTLTATPIPRTLHMSLTGVRDISVIETPPEERYPIQTYVVEYNDQLISDAIARELGRNGQVYFVYNRVEDIGRMAEYLRKLIPESKVAVAHGQMTERELEKVMHEFMNNEYNILVATTIIETGIDIPNVNTMIIYDADKMGLSQLYQLRGRVGRSNRIAYAYFTYKKDKILSEVAEKRLKAIKDFTELGSGFKIAMRDLEIRGAGNMMGSSQHGHMSAIGYDLYCRMLEDTVKLIRGEIDKEPVDTTVEIKVDAYIPAYYINDEMQKIEVYKKIAAIDGQEDFMDVKEELEDRFSDIPDSVYNLMYIAYIRSIAKTLGILEIKERGSQINFQFENKERLKESIVKAILNDNYNKKVMFKLGDKPIISYRSSNMKKEELLTALKTFVEFIAKQ